MFRLAFLAAVAAGLVASPAVAADAAAGKAKYDALCASCHGMAGKGDGPTGGAMNPKPRNFADKAWQAKVTDDQIKKVTKSGGPSVGLSPLMPPMGASLKDVDLDNLTAYIRSFGK